MAVYISSSISWPGGFLVLLMVAFTNALVDICRLVLMRRFDSPLVVLTLRSTLQSIFLILLFLYIHDESWSAIPFDIWFTKLNHWIYCGFTFATSFYYLKAIQQSSLSATLPFLAETPVWILFSGIVWYDELPDATSWLGMFILFIGHLILCISFRTTSAADMDQVVHIKSPLKQQTPTIRIPTALHQEQPSQDLTSLLIPRNKGAQMMMLVSLLWSFSASLEKNVVGTLPPLLGALMTQTTLALSGWFMLVVWPFLLYLFHQQVRIMSGFMADHSHDLDDDQLKYSKPRKNSAHFSACFEKLAGKFKSIHIEYPGHAPQCSKKVTVMILVLATGLSYASYWTFSVASHMEYMGHCIAFKRVSMLFAILLEKWLCFTAISKTDSISSLSCGKWEWHLYAALFMCTGFIILLL